MGRSNEPLITNATGDYATRGTALSVPVEDTVLDAPTDDVAAARAQIEHTRHDMSETLDAIREKLNPKELMEQAKTTVTDAAHNVLDQAKTTVHSVVSDVSEHAKEAAKEAVTGAVSGVVDEATAGVKGVVSGVKGAFSHAAEGVSDAVSNVMGGHHDKTPQSASNARPASTQPNSARPAGTRQTHKGMGAPVPFALLLSAGYYFFNRRSAAPVKPPIGRRDYQNPMNSVHPGSNVSGAGEIADIIIEEEVTQMPSNGNYSTGSRNGVNGVLDTLTDHGTSLLETAKNNPIPTALLLGSAWYLLNQRAERQRQSADPELWTDYTEYDNDYDAVPAPEKSSGGVGEAVSNTLHSVGDKAGDVKDSVTGAVSSAAATVKSTADSVADTVKTTAGSVADTAKQTAGNVANAAGSALTSVKTSAAGAVSSAKTTASGAGSSLLEAVRRDPVTLGAVALGLGAAVGLLLPGTEKENQVLGQTRDKLVDRATQSATELASKVQHVAGESFSAAKDALQETVSQTVQTAKEHAHTVKETAQHEARDQGLIP